MGTHVSSSPGLGGNTSTSSRPNVSGLPSPLQQTPSPATTSTGAQQFGFQVDVDSKSLESLASSQDLTQATQFAAFGDDENNSEFIDVEGTKSTDAGTRSLQQNNTTLIKTAETEPKKMSQIKRTLHSCLPSSAASNGDFEVVVHVDWRPQEFMMDQFNSSTDQSLGSAITLNGLALCAQATTCLDYVKHNWPLTGEKVLDALQAAVRDQSHISKGTINIFRDAAGLDY